MVPPADVEPTFVGKVDVLRDAGYAGGKIVNTYELLEQILLCIADDDPPLLLTKFVYVNRQFHDVLGSSSRIGQKLWKATSPLTTSTIISAATTGLDIANSTPRGQHNPFLRRVRVQDVHGTFTADGKDLRVRLGDRIGTVRGHRFAFGKFYKDELPWFELDLTNGESSLIEESSSDMLLVQIASPFELSLVYTKDTFNSRERNVVNQRTKREQSGSASTAGCTEPAVQSLEKESSTVVAKVKTTATTPNGMLQVAKEVIRSDPEDWVNVPEAAWTPPSITRLRYSDDNAVAMMLDTPRCYLRDSVLATSKGFDFNII